MTNPRIDELDLKILDLLQADARMPIVRIADELGVSDTTVRARVDRLIRNFDLKFVVDVDPNDLGLVYLYLAVRVQGPSLQKAIDRLSRLPEIIFLGRCTGGYDLMGEMVCRDNDDLMRVLDDIRAVPGVVEMDTYTILRVEKEDWRFSGFASAESGGGG